MRALTTAALSLGLAALIALARCTQPVHADFTIPNVSDAFDAKQSEVDKVDLDILVAGQRGDGVISGAAVAAQGTPDMTVAVASGVVKIGATVVSVSAGNVTITTANATNPRFDLVTVNNSGTKSVTAGTAAAAPAFPAIPASSVVLAAVYVPANDTAIQSNQITDKRVLLPDALHVEDRSTVPSTTATGMTLFSMERAGRRFLSTVAADGLTGPLQPALFANSIRLYSPGNGTAIGAIGMVAMATATISHPAIASTNLWTSIPRWRMATSTTAGNSSGVRAADAVWRGNAAGLGGFFFAARCTANVTTTNGRAFVGLNDTTAVIGNVNPSTLTQGVYYGFDSAQTTWRVCSNDSTGSATCTDLGAQFPVNLGSDGFEFRLFASANGSDIKYWAQRLGTGDTASGTISTDLPTNTTMLAPQLWVNNGTDASANNLECSRLYLESDY